MYPERKVFALGVSLGANILTNMMGFRGDKCKLTAAVAFVPPIKFDGHRLKTQLGGSYDAALGKSMMKLY